MEIPSRHLYVVSPISKVALRLGTNVISNFSVDGRTGMITLGWRDNGNAHGYDLFVVMLPVSASGHDWNVVGVADEHEFSDAIRDAPHTGDDMTRSIRRARSPRRTAGHDADSVRQSQ
jgi:hypothetical protein